MLPRFASNTSKYTPGHEHQEIPSAWLSLVQLCGCQGWHVQCSANAAEELAGHHEYADHRRRAIRKHSGLDRFTTLQLKDWRIEAASAHHLQLFHFALPGEIFGTP